MKPRLIPPQNGQIIGYDGNQWIVPNHPIVPFIEGDGIGSEITPVMKNIVDAAIHKVYGNARSIQWLEVYAGEKALNVYGENQWLPQDTLDALRTYRVGIKGPLTTPVGGGIRSLNVALRQQLDLYVCLRPVRYYKGSPSPVRRPELVDMVIFRENSEDIYSGIECEAHSAEAIMLADFIETKLAKKIKNPKETGFGIKPISKHGTKRLVRQAIQYAIEHHRSSVALVHKGNIMKFTEGAFAKWGYACACEEFGATPLDGGPWHVLKNPKNGEDIIIKDIIADAFFQHTLLRPQDYSVIATMNLNGDYLSDALAAQVGGIGIAPGANLNDEIALFEATHGTAPRYVGMNKMNPSSLLLSAVMMLDHMGWTEAACSIEKALSETIACGEVTYDFARLLPGSNELSTTDFGDRIITRL